MPLHTQVFRRGQPLSINWGDFHVACMVYAASIDSGVSPFSDPEDVKRQALELMDRQGHIGITPLESMQLGAYHVLGATPLNSGTYEIKEREYRFVDITDGEEFVLQPGDVLKAWRSVKL